MPVFKPYPVMTVAMLIAMALLVLLGNWQMRRLAWKEALIAEVNERVDLSPVPLDEALRQSAPTEIEYTHVTVRGHFDHAREVQVFGQDLEGVPGYFIYTPLVREDGPAVIINRGFVPEALKDPAARPEGQVSGEVTVDGLVRLTRTANIFQPANVPASGDWFVASLDEMAGYMDEGAVAPVFIDAGPAPNPGVWPRGGETRITFRNPHLGYALTWYGLAAALLAVYIAVHIGAGRLALRRSSS